eukprot:2253632-Amphidinium_carterae.1
MSVASQPPDVPSAQIPDELLSPQPSSASSETSHSPGLQGFDSVAHPQLHKERPDARIDLH